MPGRRKRSARHRARIEKFLGTECLICFTPQETPSKPLPCCGHRIHEDCLLSCFRFAVGNMRDCCPHCRSPFTFHNHGQPAPGGPTSFVSRPFPILHHPLYLPTGRVKLLFLIFWSRMTWRNYSSVILFHPHLRDGQVSVAVGSLKTAAVDSNTTNQPHVSH